MDGEAELDRVRGIRRTKAKQFFRWAAGSMFAGVLVGWGARYQDAAPRAFLEAVAAQFVIWGAINMVFAILGLRQSRRVDASTSTSESIEAELRDRDKLLRALHFNQKLNVLWVSIGFVLLVSAMAAIFKGSHADTIASLLGHAVGVLIQGGFLMIFDKSFRGVLQRAGMADSMQLAYCADTEAAMTLNFNSRNQSTGFSLIELLVTVGIISILIAVLLPTIRRAREQATVVRCAANLQQINTAFNNYLIDSRQMTFWRAPNPVLDGMDWFVFGGQETGNVNTGQAGLFNRFQPRPLNPYVNGKIEVFRCPSDDGVAAWTGLNVGHFESVGNSYVFNTLGQPGQGMAPDRGLSGVRFSKVRDSSRRILFLETAHLYDARWHPQGKANVCLADGHVAFVDLDAAVKAGEARW